MNSTITGIKCTLSDFFGYWLAFTRPMHDLTNKEITIMAVILGKRHELSMIISDPNRVDTFLFSKEIRNEIMQELAMSGTEFSGALTLLRKKNALSKENIVNKKFIPDLGFNSQTYNFIINFSISGNDNYVESKVSRKEVPQIVEGQDMQEYVQEQEIQEEDIVVVTQKDNISHKARMEPQRNSTSDLSQSEFFDRGY